jgi:hypothetical protein
VLITALLMGAWLVYSLNQVSPDEENGILSNAVLSVSAEILLENMHLLHRDSHELVPSGGMIFPAAVVTFSEGESVFDVLQREMRNARIHLAFRLTPLIGSAYIEAINNLYETDAGPLSGWVFKVNGEFPSVSTSHYILKPGDVVEFLYTLDLGRDAGNVFE